MNLNYVKLFFASPLTPLLRNDYQGGFEVNMVVN